MSSRTSSPVMRPLLLLLLLHLLLVAVSADQPPADQAATSGARSSYPLAGLADSLSLFNLFRGAKWPLDQDGYLRPLASSSSKDPPETQQDQSNKISDRKQTVKSSSPSEPASPIILVPGYGGSRLEARLDKPRVVRYFCDRKSDWTDIWINVKQLLPYMIDCLIDNLRLEFDSTTNTTRNTPGVEIRVKNGTHTSSVEYLHDLPISGFAYFAPIIDKLVHQLDYERNLNILAAPYDFRKAPNELADYFAQLKLTSEQAFEMNQRQPVTFVCHSMGCNNMLYFLQRQTQPWKDTHVRQLISLAAPWGGSIAALRATALGDDLGMPYLFSESKLIQVQRSLPSTIYLFPHKRAFPNSPLIMSNVDPAFSNHSSSRRRKVYGASDFKAFFDAIDHPDGYQMWLETKDLLGQLEPPGVKLWCLVGRGQKTLGRIEYLGDFPQSPSWELYDDGDGTVTIESAEYCKKWSEQQKQPIYYAEFDIGHMEILKHPKVIDYVEKIIDNSADQAPVSKH